MRKYQKYFSRLLRNIKSGNFLKLSASRKKFLIRKVDALRAKLANMQPRLAGAVAATGLFLALSAPQAEAQFSINQAKNPFLGVADTTLFPFVSNYSDYSSAILADIDGDGDKDALLGTVNRGGYFKNTGTSTAPIFTIQTGTNNPFENLILPTFNNYSGYTEFMSMADLDQDGDLDLIVAYYRDHTQQIYYFKNTGTITSPVFTLQTGTDNPIPIITTIGRTMFASFVDIDADGDQDIFVGGYAIYGYGNNTTFLQNTGTASAPAFVEQTGTNNPLTAAMGYSSGIILPSFVDLDADGDMDAVLSNNLTSFSYYKNTGTASAAVFSIQSGTNNPFNAFIVDTSLLNSSFADIDGDGDQDMFVGDYRSSKINYFENTGTSSAPAFDLRMGAIGYDIVSAFADIDGDGDNDAVFGNHSSVLYFKNNGPASAPVYVNVIGTDNPFNAVSGRYFKPALSDIDGDGDIDLMVVVNMSTIYYQNTGNSTAPVYTLQTGTNNPMNGVNLGFFTSPAFVDLDNDGDMDLVGGGNYSIRLRYFMNTGTVSAPVFTEQTGTSNPMPTLDGYTLSFYPLFVNIDGDSDMDMLVATSNNLQYYVNTGTASAPLFTEQTGTDNPFPIPGGMTNLSLDDIDNDGDLDLFVGQNQYDGVTLYENTNTNIVTSVSTPVATTFSGGVATYPNPVKDVLNFSLNDGIGSSMKVSVLNMAGSEILNHNFDNNGSVMSINVSELNNGIYMLRLSSATKVSVVKFVKQ